MSISQESIQEVIQPWFGSFLLSSTSLANDIEHTLVSFDPRKMTFRELHDQLYHLLLVTLSRDTGTSMQVILDGYHVRKLVLSDFEQISDELMGLLFDNLIPFSANFTRINDYAIHFESLSALRVLYLKYRDYYSKEQYSFLADMIRKTYPYELISSWLG